MTDIHKGDLVKATLKKDPEEYTVLRVRKFDPYSGCPVSVNGFAFTSHNFDFEVLERPIEEDLLVAVRSAWTGFPYNDGGHYRDDWIKVINTVREYDAKKAGV